MPRLRHAHRPRESASVPLGAIAALLLLAAMLLAQPASAERVMLPEPPAGRGDACVEPTDVMRRDHMEFILHQRDVTVHQGIRTSRHSFTGCIDCHAVTKADGSLARHDDDEHFCAGCHKFAAVRIDCFECHADRPPAAREDAAVRPGADKPATTRPGDDEPGIPLLSGLPGAPCQRDAEPRS